MGSYKKLRTSHGQEVVAAKAGISVRSARRLDSKEALPSQVKHGRRAPAQIRWKRRARRDRADN